MAMTDKERAEKLFGGTRKQVASINEMLRTYGTKDSGGGNFLGDFVKNTFSSVNDFVTEQIPGGWLTVGGLALGGAGLLASGAGAGAAAGAAGAGGSVGGIGVGGAFVPTVGSGASFTLPAAAAGAGGSIGGISLGGAFTPTAGSGASFTLPGSAALMGPTYAELGVTGVEGGLAGPTYAELGYTGLNNAEAIAAADAASKAAAAKISITPSQAIQGLRMASGLLGGQQGTPAAATPQFRGSTMPQGAVDYSGILNLLQARSPQLNPYSLLG